MNDEDPIVQIVLKSDIQCYGNGHVSGAWMDDDGRCHWYSYEQGPDGEIINRKGKLPPED